MRQMREMDDVKHIPIVFMTAKAQTHEQEAYLSLGVLGVIVKPFDPMTLCDELRDMWAKT
jgi:CheY-like chemotaxis protein